MYNYRSTYILNIVNTFIYFNDCAVHLKLGQHWKSTIFQ